MSADIEWDKSVILNADNEHLLALPVMSFIKGLVERYGASVDTCLDARKHRSIVDCDFARSPEELDSSWRAAPPPADLIDRRVEITGPPTRKGVINALNSGADVFMADFEDSCSPTWDNLISGQVNLFNAVRRTITYDDPTTGKHYSLNDKPAVLMVRPRGWHLKEKHVRLDGKPVPAALVDFGLYVFNNAHELLSRGSGPYLYLPKMESHHEAKLWDDVCSYAEQVLNLPMGAIRTTCLIETLPAAFCMDRIIYALRDRIVGLNCGRWDYIFSFIKKRHDDPSAVLPDRSLLTMDKAFLNAYDELLVQTCHKRGIHAMGGMAAQIPIKGNAEANDVAMEKVHTDKLREAAMGHDGTWVAHPGLIQIAREAFKDCGPNQIDRPRTNRPITRDELLLVPSGPCTEEGLRHNIRVGIQYLEAWLSGNGCVPLYNLMEDAATAEISRAQIWQQLHHGAIVGGRPLTYVRLADIISQETMPLVGARIDDAIRLFMKVACDPHEFTDFLTLPAYDML